MGDLAAAADCHAPSLNRVLRLLASAGVFEEQAGGRFALTHLGDLLRTDMPGSMHAMVSLFAGIGVQDSWRELEYCVRTGNPAFRKDNPDASPFDMIERDPEMAEVFDKAMATFAPQMAAAVADAYDFSRFKTVADIGGGNGALMIGVLKANPGLKGLVFDLPRVAARATDEIRKAGLEGRCETRGGSFFEHIPEGPDAYVMKHVIHDWNDEDAMKILANCHKAMGQDGTLLIVEGVYPERIDTSPESRGAAANDVNMLVATGGRQRSEEEFRSLYAMAGFRLVRIVPTAARVAVIEGKPV